MKFVKIIVNYTLRHQQALYFPYLRSHQLLSAQRFYTAEIKPIVNIVFSVAIDHLRYIPRYFDMSTSQALSRHAQTQHGIASAGDENIILCKAALFVPPSVDTELTDAPEGDAQKSTQCVWFHDIEEQSSNSDNVDLLPSNDQLQEKETIPNIEKRKAEDTELSRDIKKPKLETKVLKVKRPGFSEERYNETSYYMENGLRKVYPYHFTFTTFTKGRWIGEKILDVFAREFRAHPAEEYERSINSGSLSVNYETVPTDYRLKHNDLLANIVHRHEVPVTCEPITIVHMDDDIVVVNKPASIPVHPCGRYRHNTVVFILAKEYNLKNLRTIHRLDRLTSGILLFGRNPNKARQLEQQIRSRVVEKEYICRVEGNFPEGIIECHEPIEVVSYKIGVCRVSPKGKECTTTFEKLSYNGKTSVVLCKPLTGRMHQIRVHLQYLGFPIINDPLYNHVVFGPQKGRGGDIGGRTDAELVHDLITIHNAENWLGIDSDADISLFKPIKEGIEGIGNNLNEKPEELSPETSPKVPSGCPPTVDTLNETPSADSYGKAGSDDAGTHPNVGVTTVATQTGHESPDMAFKAEKLSVDKHCYECRVRYRDPKPQDLVMYLHAWKYKGPGWEYETKFPHWGEADWDESKISVAA